MKLTYKLLWFDDNQSIIDNFRTQLEPRFDSVGLALEIDIGTCSREYLEAKAQELSRFNPYSFVLFDCKMGRVEGPELAVLLRKKIKTDIVYYSSYGGLHKLRQDLFDVGVDGAFCVASGTDFIDSLWDIFKTHIEHDYDLENMRGVIMDEMSIIESWSRARLSKRIDELTPEEVNLLKSSIKRICKDHIKCLQKFSEKLGLNELRQLPTMHTTVDFDKVRRQLQKIYPDAFGDGSSIHNLQKWRNKLAHQNVVYDKESGSLTLIDCKDPLNSTLLTGEQFVEIRKLALSCRKKIKELDI